MKSGYCTIMWNGRVHGPSKINPPPTMPKSSLLPKKVMLCIWWDWNGVLYCEVFLKNQMINSSKYCFLLDQLKTALDEQHPELVNRKCIIFHQETTRLLISLMTRKKILVLGQEILSHLPYSPNIVPSNFHLFQSLQNSLDGGGKKIHFPGSTWNNSLFKNI